MSFTIKPPLYAVDASQVNDLLFAYNFHSNIKNWIRNIKNFPIEKGSSLSTSTGLLLFERFSPWFDNWCSDYTTKLYEFYKYISESIYYNEAYFNGYGLLDEDYGDMLIGVEAYDFNIPPSITLTNSTNNFVSITYFQRSYTGTFVYFNRMDSDVDIYIKRRILIEPFSVIKLSTENILCCSMVLNGANNLTPTDVGIPSGLNYLEWDYHLNEIKETINNSYPKLRQKINQIDYEVICTSGGSYDINSSSFTIDHSYEQNFTAGSLTLGTVPSWFYSAALMYGNNDYWGSQETIKSDLGKELNVIIGQYNLQYDFLHIPDRENISSNVLTRPIRPDGVIPYYPTGLKIAIFSYRPGEGIYYGVSSDYDPQFDNPQSIFSQQHPVFFDVGVSPIYGEGTTYGVINRLWFTTSYTNTGICQRINEILFSTVDGIVSAYNSLIVNTTIIGGDTTGNFDVETYETDHGLSRFVANGLYDTASNYLTLTMEVDEQAITNTYQANFTGEQNRIVNQSSLGSANADLYTMRGSNNPPVGSYLSKDNSRTNVDYTFSKSLIFAVHSSDPRTIRSNTDQEIIDFVNNIIIPEYEDNIFMVDSTRIIEIHEALNAGKFANDPEDTDNFRFANLGYYIERIARILGISVDPDGSIRSVRQRGYKEPGDTIPPGWPIGQWGRNQGGSSDGQKGGKEEDDKDGITYPVISNKYTLDEFTGEPDKIVEGGYVLCENIIQYLETLKDDLDKALGLQYAGANSFPLPNGNGDVSFEGLSILLQENTYMLSQLSCQISSAQISSLVTQAVVAELLAHCGVPTTIKELKVDIANGETVSIPYPAITETSPSQFDQTLLLLANLAPLLGGKINIRHDHRIEENE
ncbi:MAG: hypothetical protein MK111_08680 [Crocosphaera sp.]|uniref:hypothetical protein n=2 Tax=Crocosphaera TaxID=263510 RepID=UPI00258E948D|nr:hypothetical protein [Crocosphaera sp.]MCH2244701.1 hypothetical protein [Crocosphaera sp.]